MFLKAHGVAVTWFQSGRASAASERAQRAKRAERLRCLSAYSSGFSGRFTETTEKNTTRRRNENHKTRFPFPYLDRFGGLPVAFRTVFRFQRRPKTSPRWFPDTSQTVQVQDGARTAQGAAKIFSRWLQGIPQTAHDGTQIDENP